MTPWPNSGAPVALVDANGKPFSPAAPDPQALRIAELEKEVAEMKALCATQKAKIREAEVEMLVSLAIDEGKLLGGQPALRKWAVEMGRRDFATLQAFIGGAFNPAGAAGGES